METEKQEKWQNRTYMLHENELWLSVQAEKGLVLKSFDKDYAHFTEDKIQKIAYKIVILSEKKAENEVKIIESQGFTFVGSHEEYYIFYIDRKYEHIQPKLNQEMIKFTIKWFNKQMIKRFAGTIIAMIPIALNLTIMRDKAFQAIVELSTIWFVIWGFLFIASIIDGIKELRAVIRTKKCFLEHEAYLLDRSPKKSNIWRIGIIGICIFAGISIIKVWYVDPPKYSIADVQKDMPIVLLQDIEGDKELSQELKISQRTVSEGNYAQIKHTLMAPKQYHAWQANSNYDMSIQYYEVAVEKLAEPLAKELLTKGFLHVKREDIEKVNFDGLDAVYIYKYEGSVITTVSACKGKRVMYIWYDNGDAPVEDILREMAEVL